MRILYVVEYYKPAYLYGGPVLSTSGLCEGMVQAGAEVTVFTTNANGRARLDVSLQQETLIEGVKVWYFPIRFPGLAFYAPDLTRAVQERAHEFDLVILEAMWGHALSSTATVCARQGIPYVIPLRGQLLPWALQHKRLKKQLYLSLFALRHINRAAALHCTDESERRGVEALNLKPPVFVVPNAIDFARFLSLPPREVFRARLGIPANGLLALCVGRIARIKGIDLAVEALGQARRSGIPAYLAVVGPDQENLAGELGALAQGLGCADYLRFTGLLDGEALLSAFAGADVMLMPSRVQENFGMAALEGLASGLPLVASRGVPVGGWAQKAGAGLWVSGQNGEFQRVFVQLTAQPDVMRAMGQRGRLLAQSRFDILPVAKSMLNQFAAILESGSPVTESVYDMESSL